MKRAVEAGPVTLEVYNPAGATETTELYAPRLADLNGKTICELSNGAWQHDRIFPVIRTLLKERFPDATIVPYTEFPIGNITIDIAENIGEILKERGADAVIGGMAA